MNCCFFKKKNKIKPIHYIQNNLTEDLSTEDLSTEDFLHEIIICGTCRKAFSLRENQLSALCGGCNQFLHCGIAGKCVGPNCGNRFHRLTWCKQCIPKNIIINLQDLGPDKDCLCQECLDDDRTPACYKRSI
jgi:uncharacterized CHY-type Zn-finger protein